MHHSCHLKQRLTPCKTHDTSPYKLPLPGIWSCPHVTHCRTSHTLRAAVVYVLHRDGPKHMVYVRISSTGFLGPLAFPILNSRVSPGCRLSKLTLLKTAPHRRRDYPAFHRKVFVPELADGRNYRRHPCQGCIDSLVCMHALGDMPCAFVKARSRCRCSRSGCMSIRSARQHRSDEKAALLDE